MGKLNLSKSFDVGRTLQALTKAGVSGEIEDFVVYLGDLSNQVISLLNGSLTLKDNASAFVKEVDLQHDVPLSINLGSNQARTPFHVFITKAVPFDNPATSFAWQIAIDGTIQVQASLKNAGTSTAKITLVMLF